jgi:hypothetical protein
MTLGGLVKSALLSQKLHDATLHELHKNVKWMGRQIHTSALHLEMDLIHGRTRERIRSDQRE